nr:hypothetical protein [Desulfobacula sp.]
MLKIGRNRKGQSVFKNEYLDSNDIVKDSSNQTFGFVFAAFFFFLFFLPLLHEDEIHWWLLGVAVVLLIISLTIPDLLAPFNRIWLQLGLLLHNITTPIIMGVLFFGVVTPMALIMRVLGKNPLALTYNLIADSYWILRDPPGPVSESMKNQF